MKTDEGEDRQNKRGEIRHTCTKMTEFFIEGRAYLGCIKNESKSGVFIETRGKFRIGQAVAVSYAAAGVEYQKTGKIVSIHPDGIGVKFNAPGYTR